MGGGGNWIAGGIGREKVKRCITAAMPDFRCGVFVLQLSLVRAICIDCNVQHHILQSIHFPLQNLKCLCWHLQGFKGDDW